jgi:hypothetical protein
MIDENVEVSAAEICLLSGYVKSRLGQLESIGIIKRSRKDCWPLAATMRALIEHARARSAAYSEAKGRIEVARAKALELRIAREEGKLAPLDEWHDAMTVVTGKLLVGMDGPVHRYTRDLTERRKLDGLVAELRNNVANWLVEEGDRLEEEARKSARRRL